MFDIYWLDIIIKLYISIANKHGFQFAREYMVELESFLENNLPK